MKRCTEVGVIASTTSAPTEWLVYDASYSHGDITFFAVNADETLSKKLDAATGTALFAMKGITFSGLPADHPRPPHLRPGYQMETEI